MLQVLDDAKFLCKRPQNIPSADSWEKIAVIEAAFKARNERMKLAREQAQCMNINYV